MTRHHKVQAMRTICLLALAGWLILMPATGLGQAGEGARAPGGAASDALAALPATAPAPKVKAKAPAPKVSDARYALVGYNRSIHREHFAGLNKASVLKMQQQLELIYRNLADWQHDAALHKRPLDDGVVGPVTLLWLQRYGFNFKSTSGADVGKAFPDHMDRMALFARAHPAELAILLDQRFEDWDSANGTAQRAQDYEVRRVGEESALIALVTRYRARSKAVPLLARADDGQYRSDNDVYYVLNARDLAALGGKQDVGKTLAILKDQSFASKEALKVSVEKLFEGRADVMGKVWPAIDNSVRQSDGYLLNPTSVVALQKEGMDAVTLKELTAFGTVYLKSRDAFDNYITNKIATGELTISDEGIQHLARSTTVPESYHLEQQTLDTIGRQLSGSINYVGLPAVVAKMLAQIKGVNYYDPAIFHSAATSKLSFGLGMCKSNTPTNNPYEKTLGVSDAELASLRKEIEVLRPLPIKGVTIAASELDQLFKDISALRDHPDRCDDKEKKLADESVNRLYQSYLIAVIDSAGRKKMPDKVAKISIKGGDCGCALDDLAGVVYGFYPYWANQKPNQAINFRALNRMAYYGLNVDNDGELLLGKEKFNLLNGDDKANDFVRTARQYNSNVDWMVQKSDWRGDWGALNPQSKKAMFDRLLLNISTLLNAPLTHPGARVRNAASLGLADRPRRGDGVTLYFPNYPEDIDSTTLFNSFYMALRAEMDKHGLWLNILVAQNTLARGNNGQGGAFGLYNQVKLREPRAFSGAHAAIGAHENNEYLLVLLNEPSADAKKRLRLDMENDSMLHGAKRADFLRSILPVLHFDDHNWQQLDDDIVYSHDNFGGVGFWAPNFDNMDKPIKDEGQTCLTSQQMAVCLLKNLHEASLNASDGVSDSLPGPVELMACVHRWLLHVVLLVVALTGITLIALFFISCPVQKWIKDHFLWVQVLVALPALLIFILLMLYDPAMYNVSHGNLPFFISAGIIMIGLGAGYLFWRAQRQVPQRERGLAQREGP